MACECLRKNERNKIRARERERSSNSEKERGWKQREESYRHIGAAREVKSEIDSNNLILSFRSIEIERNLKEQLERVGFCEREGEITECAPLDEFERRNIFFEFLI